MMCCDVLYCILLYCAVLCCVQLYSSLLEEEYQVAHATLDTECRAVQHQVLAVQEEKLQVQQSVRDYASNCTYLIQLSR